MNAVVDRVVQYAHRYQLTNTNTGEIIGTFDLEPITGTISVVGTKIDKTLFDSIASDIGARLVANGGNAKDNIITYTYTTFRNNIRSGEKLSASFAKIQKYFNDLKAVAFSGDKADIGLGNVDNTADKDKPVSKATQTAINAINKADIGLGNVDNTADTAIPTKDSTDKFTSGGAYTELAKKVDKVAGSSLMTDAEHNKLSGIADGAEVNVNADWNATSGDAVILNKPTIPTVPVQSVNSKTGSVVLTGSDITTSSADSETLDNKTIANMLHLGAYDTYTYNSTTKIYTVTRQTQYINSSYILEHGITTDWLSTLNGLFGIKLDTLSTNEGINVVVNNLKNYSGDLGINNTAYGISTNIYDGGTLLRGRIEGYTTEEQILTYLSSYPIFIQFKSKTSHIETYNERGFARTGQQYIEEWKKREADRSSNLMPNIYLTSTTVPGFLMKNTAFVLKAGTYSIKLTSDQNGGSSYQVQFNNKEISAGASQVGSYLKFTLTVDAYNITIYCNGANSNIKIMLNEGSTALPYQPYEGKVIHEDELNAKQDKLVSGSNIKTINYQSIVGAGNISITEGLFELVGNDVDTLTITKNETYFITAVAYNKIYVSENADIGFYGSSIISTISMFSGNPHIAINGFAYTLSSNKVTLITDGLMNVYKKKI